MDITTYFNGFMEIIAPVLLLSSFLSLTINVIVMLVNMLINAFTGKGLKW